MYFVKFLVLCLLAFSGLAMGIDYNASNIREVVTKKYGLPFPKGYDRSLYSAAYTGDNKLPTGLINAIEKKGIYVNLWRAEMAIDDEDYKLALKLLQEAEKEDPNNPTIYWLYAKNLMMEGLRQDEKATKIKGKLFKKGYQYALKCRALAPEDYNCEMHIGALLGRVMTNAGIWSTLFNAGKVEKAFNNANRLANEGKQHYRYASGNTSIGVSAFALGVMYRLAPHGWFMRLLSPVDGDLDKSIKFHKQTLKTKPTEAEYSTELGASYLCKWQLKKDKEALRIGKEVLTRCSELPVPRTATSKISHRDCSRLKNSPKLACGYSKDRQQETDPDKIKAQVKKE